jgi:glucosamine--fructose-6-phosphate aminotransferase (isomerizing)
MQAFLREAVTEGEALRDLIDYYASEGSAALDSAGRLFRSGGYRRVAFAGMGSSYSASFAILDHLIRRCISAIAVTAHKLARDRAMLVTTDTMVVAISKSGTTQEVLDLVQGTAASIGLVALVNRTDCVLADRCEVVLPMRAGSETQIASKSFLCTLAVLNLLAAELTGAPRPDLLRMLRDIARWSCRYLAAAAQNNEPGLAALEGCTQVDVLACGASFSTAYKSALVLREVPRLVAAAIDCADFAHGWGKVAQQGYVGIVLAPEYHEASIAARAVKQMLDRGGRAIIITSDTVVPREGLTVLCHPAVPERLAPLVQVVICDALIGAMPGISEDQARR